MTHSALGSCACMTVGPLSHVFFGRDVACLVPPDMFAPVREAGCIPSFVLSAHALQQHSVRNVPAIASMDACGDVEPVCISAQQGAARARVPGCSLI